MNECQFFSDARKVAAFLARRTTANKVTIARCSVALLMIPVWFFGGWHARFFAACVWGVCWYLDAIDGIMAREEGQASETGKWLDPLADKIQFYSTILLFWNECDLIALGGLFIADGYSTVERGFGKKMAVVGANSFGKWKMVMQIVALFSFIIAELFSFSFLIIIANGALFVGCGFAFVSILKRRRK
ncbi:MAG: CDP-alcohol phosphatidyltransferase family protein [Parcubacteria group bacterium]|nr:CDP-alcohol phosphatidyltransferase family protein [Parcubacteria group bacterium]